MLNEARMRHWLVDVLNGWAPAETSWTEKRRYVGELAAAARSLVEMELIDVYEAPSGVGEYAPLFRDDAIAEIENPDNWWGEDWDQEPSDDDKPVRILALGPTERARTRLR